MVRTFPQNILGTELGFQTKRFLKLLETFGIFLQLLNLDKSIPCFVLQTKKTKHCA
jgi:hypothetical protein